MNEDDTRLCWVDLETTGLHEDCEILEVGMVVTDRDLEPVAAFHAFIHHDLSTLLMSDGAWQMHRNNGLWDELVRRRDERWMWECSVTFGGRSIPGMRLARGSYDRGFLTQTIDDFVKEHALGCPLAGSTVSFDRRHMTRYWPRAVSMLHYRNVDVSSIRELLRRFRPDVALRPKSDKHRSLDDLDVSIDVARVFRAFVVPPEAP